MPYRINYCKSFMVENFRSFCGLSCNGKSLPANPLLIIRCFLDSPHNCKTFPANNKKCMQPRKFSTTNDLHYMVLHWILAKFMLASQYFELDVILSMHTIIWLFLLKLKCESMWMMITKSSTVIITFVVKEYSGGVISLFSKVVDLQQV